MGTIIFRILYTISAVCLWALLSAILLNFFFSRRSAVRKEKKSVVETGSMLGFFLAMVLFAAFNLGRFSADIRVALPIAIAGVVMIVAGTSVNIAGRLTLKGNWGNQIRLYENHSLTTTGIYRYIRHPLYASTILMLFGFSFLFLNYLVFLAVAFIFIPFMAYRARQEDDMLLAAFKEEFASYRAKTGSLFPKFRK
ncbi:MAG: methyltransferase family protein [Saccharofermentanales bacterium]